MFQLLLAVAVGFATYALGKLFEKIVIEPVQDLRRTRGKVANVLIRHWGFGGAWCNEDGDLVREDPEDLKSVRAELRNLAAEVQGNAAVIPCYPVVAFVFRLPSVDGLRDATRELNNWSVRIYCDGASTLEPMENIERALRLDALHCYNHTGNQSRLRREARAAAARKRPRLATEQITTQANAA